MQRNIVIIGANGAIGNAFVQHYMNDAQNRVFAFSRKINPTNSQSNLVEHHLDYTDEAQIASAASIATETGPIDQVIVATGILHDDTTSPPIKPEKALKQLSAEQLLAAFQANTVTPALVAKHFIPQLNRKSRSVFAALSARVGSISDNQLGGWYSYRASKAALNMLIKTTAIETNRTNKHAIIIGLHPGTVDSPLSKPFQKHVPAEKLFSPQKAVTHLAEVIEQLTTKDSGLCFAWDGQPILP